MARSLQMGGIERNTITLANNLVEMGHDVHIVVYKKRPGLVPDPRVYIHYFDIDKINRITVIGLIYDLFTRTFLAPLIPRSGFVWRGIYGSWFFRLLLRKLEKQFGSIDKIITRGQGAFEMLWRLRDPRCYQVIVSPIDPPSHGWLDRWYSRLLFAGKNNVCNSTGVMESVKARLQAYGYSARQLVVISNPIPIDRIEQLSHEPVTLPQRPFIVHVARLTYQKNQELLIRAFHAANVEEDLVIIGGGQDRSKLEKLVVTLGLDGRVLFLGQLENPYPWMRAAKLFVLSSRYEGFGLVMAEAHVCGTPVVAVDCRGGVRDVLIEEQTRLISEPTVERLADKIREGITDPVEVRREWVERFEAKKIASQFLELS
ncbi:MAG: glycosyltransferase [Gammaproteobacteria bacterium]|nr:glycosyltransferase [Gammaproteobacteria bacterium]